MTAAMRPSILPVPVTTPSAQVRRPAVGGVSAAWASRPTSPKVPSSKRRPRRSLTVSLPSSCWRATSLAPPIPSASALRPARSRARSRMIAAPSAGDAPSASTGPPAYRTRFDVSYRTPRSIGAGERVLSVAGPIVGNVMTSGVGSQAGRDAGPATRDDAWPQARPDTVPEAGSDIVQGVLDGLARPLAETDFVIVDLETTGGSLDDAAITEIAAVRTRFGEREETSPVSPNGPCSQADREFATLVNPGRAIPPHVAALTGITDALVTSAPRVEDVLPRFIEFAAGCVLVAHNAPFDIGFLTAACAQHQVPWPALPTLDTAALARRVLTTDEVRDCRLATLARYFGATTRPSHRALDDARATAAVLHGLIDRLASRGVHTLEELRGFAEPSAPQRRRMRQLTATVPRAPGVCL